VKAEEKKKLNWVKSTSLSRKSYANKLRAHYGKLAQHPSFQFLHVPLRNLPLQRPFEIEPNGTRMLERKRHE